MRKITAADRILLLAAGLLAAYQIVTGIEGKPALVIAMYTIAFGVLLIAGLVIVLLGFDVLEHPLIAITATLIPLSLSVGLVSEYYPHFGTGALFMASVGFVAVALSRMAKSGKTATFILAFVHGVSGLLITGLPILLSMTGKTAPGFALVGLGGGLIGIGGLLLSFLKAGHPLLSRQAILAVLPLLLFLMTAAFVAGSWLG